MCDRVLQKASKGHSKGNSSFSCPSSSPQIAPHESDSDDTSKRNFASVEEKTGITAIIYQHIAGGPKGRGNIRLVSVLTPRVSSDCGKMPFCYLPLQKPSRMFSGEGNSLKGHLPGQIPPSVIS